MRTSIFKTSAGLIVLASASIASAILPGSTTNLWPFIAKIGPSPGSLNTGCAAIGDHWVVTAKHVVAGSAQMQVQFDSGLNLVSAQVYEHPTDDIALVRFSQTLPGWYEPHWNTPPVGSLMELVGYGWTGTWNGSTWAFSGSYGTKRRARNTHSLVAVVDLGPAGSPNYATCMVGDFDSGQAQHNIWDNLGVTNEGTLAPFDSGTGVMIQEAGVWKVAGVNTFVGMWPGFPNAPQYGSIFGCLQLSAYRTWVDSIMPREVRPTMLHENRGIHIQGNMASLFSSDDDHLIYRPGITFGSGQAPVEFDVMATSPTLNPPRFVFAIESSASSASIQRTVQFYNYDTNQFEAMTPSSSTLADSVTEYEITSNAGRFVHSNGEVWARISAKAIGPVFQYPWVFRTDRTVWNIKMP